MKNEWRQPRAAHRVVSGESFPPGPGPPAQAPPYRRVTRRRASPPDTRPQTAADSHHGVSRCHRHSWYFQALFASVIWRTRVRSDFLTAGAPPCPDCAGPRSRISLTVARGLRATFDAVRTSGLYFDTPRRPIVAASSQNYCQGLLNPSDWGSLGGVGRGLACDGRCGCGVMAVSPTPGRSIRNALTNAKQSLLIAGGLCALSVRIMTPYEEKTRTPIADVLAVVRKA